MYYSQGPRLKQRKRWFGFYSQEAVERGCPVFVYQGRNGSLYSVTTLCQRRDGYNYYWPDKILVGEITGYRFIETIGFDESERTVPDGVYLNGRPYNGQK